MTDKDDRRTLIVLSAVRQHLDYARTLVHELVNSYEESVTTPAIASEQAVEMDIRHALTDLVTFANALNKMGGAL